MPLLHRAKRRTSIESLKKNVLLILMLMGLSFNLQVEASDDIAKDFNATLLAELYYSLGDPQQATFQYLNLALNSDDPKIVERATEIAARSSQRLNSLKLAKHWVSLSPKGLNAHQYLALLLLRNNQFDLSAKQLAIIYQLHEDETPTSSATTKLYSNGLKFIGAMLSAESHHKLALKAFNTYLGLYKNSEKLETYQEQLFLIQASLAEKAKKHKTVLDAISQYESIRLDSSYAEKSSSNGIVAMKVKALKALRRTSEAVHFLQPIIDDNRGSDSLQLELVRLLIINKQKVLADPYLEELVVKHPDNNDLRKSLIALEIDQKKLIKARKNILELKKSQAFKNDALYFLAEITEAEGDLIGALENYQKVKAGSLLKNAQGKISRLTKILDKKVKVNYKKITQ